MKKIKYVFLFFILFAGTLFPYYADAVSITVRRVVFEGGKRAQVLTVINDTNEEQTYRVTWRHFKMTENKALTPVSENALPSDIKPSKDMVRFAPRRFTLPSGGSQQVRMMLRMPSGMPDGEYRSHLSIAPEEDVEAFRKRLEADPRTKGRAGAFMKMLAGTTIPVIVRKGALEATGSVEGLSVVNQGAKITANFSISRTGSKSVYGDLDLICNEGSGAYLLRFMRGVAIYPETDRRLFSVESDVLPSKAACSTLTVKYTELDGASGEVVGVFAKGAASVQ